MNTRIFLSLAITVVLVTGTVSMTAQKGKKAGTTTDQVTLTYDTDTKNMNQSIDSTSYAIGLQMGKSLVDQGIDFNVEQLAAGIRDFKAGTPKLSPEQIQQILMSLQEASMKRMQAEQNQKGEANGKKGQAFLAENKKDPNVKVTESGLQYKVIKEGTGKKPLKSNTVKVHYTGKLIDGTVFDSSVERGEPIEFPLSNVIAGWTEGVQLMPVGSKYVLYIPADLAYGPNGAGQTIGPNETLIFEVELLDITK